MKKFVFTVVLVTLLVSVQPVAAMVCPMSELLPEGQFTYSTLAQSDTGYVEIVSRMDRRLNKGLRFVTYVELADHFLGETKVIDAATRLVSLRVDYGWGWFPGSTLIADVQDVDGSWLTVSQQDVLLVPAGRTVLVHLTNDGGLRYNNRRIINGTVRVY